MTNQECKVWTEIINANSNESVFYPNQKSTLGLLLILFTTNTWIVMKKMFLNMIMFIKQQIIKHINGRSQKKLASKIELIIL